jgi:hypothetical protein
MYCIQGLENQHSCFCTIGAAQRARGAWSHHGLRRISDALRTTSAGGAGQMPHCEGIRSEISPSMRARLSAC